MFERAWRMRVWDVERFYANIAYRNVCVVSSRWNMGVERAISPNVDFSLEVVGLICVEQALANCLAHIFYSVGSSF